MSVEPHLRPTQAPRRSLQGTISRNVEFGGMMRNVVAAYKAASVIYAIKWVLILGILAPSALSLMSWVTDGVPVEFDPLVVLARLVAVGAVWVVGTWCDLSLRLLADMSAARTVRSVESVHNGEHA